MSDEPKIINTEEDLKHARALETSNELDAMAATIRALWKERDALTNLGCKAVDLTTEISEGAGKEIAELRAMVDTKIEDVVTFCRGEADVVFLKTSHPVPLGTIDRIGKALREKLGKDTLFVLLEGDAEVEALSEKEMREQGWARADKEKPVTENFSPLTRVLRLRADVDEAVKNLLKAIDRFGSTRSTEDPHAVEWVRVQTATEGVKENRRILWAALDALQEPPEFVVTPMSPRETAREKVKLSVTVPETMTGIANRFLQSITFPTPKLDGGLSPPTPISVERGSNLLGDYFVESLKIRPLGIDAGGSPRATAIEVVAIPIKSEPMRIEIGDGEIEDNVFVCPECKAEHSRGPLDPLSQVYRCLKCGYVGTRAKDEWVPCPDCNGTGNGLDLTMCPCCNGTGKKPKE